MVGQNKTISCDDEDYKEIKILCKRMTCERYFGRTFAMEFNECSRFCLFNVLVFSSAREQVPENWDLAALAHPESPALGTVLSTWRLSKCC